MIPVMRDPEGVAGMSEAPGAGRAERWLAWLDSILPVVLAAVAGVQLLAWLPDYLTWPLWADHDVFATAARSWDAGRPPYRDLLGNNFPGTTYLFWILGRAVGWDRTWAFWAFDAALLVGFLALLLAWSRRVLGSVTPGLIGCLAILGYGLSLDYSQAAQRDWHAPLLALGGLLVLGNAPGTGRSACAGILLGLAVAFRPQAVLFAPAHLAALGFLGEASRRARLTGALGWAVGMVLATAAWVAPLVAAGIWRDYLQALRAIAPGGGYSQSGTEVLIKELVQQALQPRYVIAAAGLGMLVAWPRWRGLALVALVALGGVWMYAPVSPVQHAYLRHPLQLTWCWALTVLAAALLAEGVATRRLRPILALVLVVVACPSWPRFSNPMTGLRVAREMAAGRWPASQPMGYARNVESGSAGRYEWDDYHAALGYLSRELPRETRVANALHYTPAVTGPVARETALPAESIAWLTVVRRADEPRFVTALENATDSVVVWDPDEPEGPRSRLPEFEAAIRRLYEPQARFGTIAVWRRRDSAAVAGRAPRDEAISRATARQDVP